MSADPKVEYKVLVVGGGNTGISALMASALAKLDKEVIVIDKPIPYVINTIPPSPKITLVEHGSYRQFEKTDKRKNYRR